MSTLKLATNALHAGHDVTTNGGTRAVPIYQTTSYVFNNSEHAANLFSLKELGFIYTRWDNPTNQILQDRLAAVEGGIGAVVFASGTAAIATGLLTLLKAGDHIVASSSLYGGTYNLLSVTLPRLGITTTFVDASNPDNFDAAVQENTRAFFAESLGNPKLDVLDLEAISVHAKKAEVPFIVDNTVATPVLLNPIKHGADIVIHSLTKYIGGQGTSLGGAIIDAGTFNWANGKFPEFTEPSAGYHGLKYYETLGAASYVFKLILEGLRDFGGALSPTNAFNIIQGLETVAVRMKQHCANAEKAVDYLSKHESVARVIYPNKYDGEIGERAKKYLKGGNGALVGIELKGGIEAGKKFIEALKMFYHVANIGDARSLAIHPGSTTHSQLNEKELLAAGVTPGYVRLAIGIEHIDDIIEDLEQALDRTSHNIENIKKAKAEGKNY